MFFLNLLTQKRNEHLKITKGYYGNEPTSGLSLLYPFLCANICFNLNKNITEKLAKDLKKSLVGGVFIKNNIFFTEAIKQTVSNVYNLKPKVINPSVGNLKNYKSALKILKSQTKNFSKELDLLLLGVVFMSGKKIIAFTEIELPGIIFLKPRNDKENITFYIEHIIHEVSHISLNYMLQNLHENFKLENPFFEQFTSPFRSEKRGLFGTFHASFVLGRLIIILEEILAKKGLNRTEKMEILARMLLCIVRLKEALGSITGDYYKNFALEIFKELQEILNSRQNKYKNYLKEVDFSNQDVEFVWEKFIQNNIYFIKKYESIF